MKVIGFTFNNLGEDWHRPTPKGDLKWPKEKVPSNIRLKIAEITLHARGANGKLYSGAIRVDYHFPGAAAGPIVTNSIVRLIKFMRQKLEEEN